MSESADQELQQNRELLQLLRERDHRNKYRKIDSYFPDTGPLARTNYPTVMKYYSAGKTYLERLLSGGNGTGKTTDGAIEMWFHASGLYPTWWPGHKFSKPIVAWALSKSGDQMKSAMQTTMFGPRSDRGAGVFPKDALFYEDGKQRWTNWPGIPNCIGSIMIAHYTNGVYDGDSLIEFKTYDQEAEALQGANVQFIWLDEEPNNPMVYTECLSRTRGRKGQEGRICMTFTPLQGMSDVVLSFCPQGDVPLDHLTPGQPGKWSAKLPWAEIPYEQLSKEWRETAMMSYAPHERAARMDGTPCMGSGAVFPYPNENITFYPTSVPPSWFEFCYGLDVGWNATAAVWLYKDPQTNIWYAYSEYQQGQLEPPMHSRNLKQRGDWIPGAIDPASNGRSQADGHKLFEAYLNEGLDLCPADNTREASIFELQTALSSGLLKISTYCTTLLSQLHRYHRDDKGQVVQPEKYHCIDALRYAWMTGRHRACPKPDVDSYSYDHSNTGLGANPITGY